MGSFPETYYRIVLSPALKQRLDATQKSPIHYPDKKGSLSSPLLRVCLRCLRESPMEGYPGIQAPRGLAAPRSLKTFLCY